MSTFSVNARRIRAIEPHTNADTLEFVVIDDYRAIVRKGVHEVGDLVVYIPEAAVTNETVLRALQLWDEVRQKGKCAGEDGLRVRALMLRGRLSQGLVFPLVAGGVLALPADTWYLVLGEAAPVLVHEGDELSQHMGIAKYKPEIPAELLGKVFDGGIEFMPRFDVEDIKKYPDVFLEGEEVVMTEKLHGTFGGFLKLSDALAAGLSEGPVRVFSKGLSEGGLAFALVPDNAGNPYVRAFTELGLDAKLTALRTVLVERGHPAADLPVFLFGEIVGTASRQDLKYGESLGLRVFALGYGLRSSLTYVDYDERVACCAAIGLPLVPLIYRGAYSKQALAAATDGRETYSGKSLHIREGVVVTPVIERRHPDLGRVMLKSVSAAYLVRGGAATEFN